MEREILKQIMQSVTKDIVQTQKDVEHMRQHNEQVRQDIEKMKAGIKYMQIILIVFSASVAIHMIATLIGIY